MKMVDFSKATCAHGSVRVWSERTKKEKRGGKRGERALAGALERRRDVCVKTRALMKFRKRDGRSSPPCRDIAAVALCINFCRQSALAAESGCMDQNRISSLWQYKVRSLKLDTFWSFEQKFLSCKFAAGWLLYYTENGPLKARGRLPRRRIVM